MSTFLKTTMGKVIVGCGAAICVIAIAAAAFFLRSKEEAYRTIVVIEVNGTAFVSNDKSQNTQAYSGMVLFDGDVVTVSQDSNLTIELDGDKYVYAEPGTKFKLEAVGATGSDKTVIHLESGATLNHVKNALNDNQSFVVQTPTSTISVRGTVFHIEAAKDESNKSVTNCEIYEGKTEVAPIDENGQPTEEHRMVIAGYAVTFIEVLPEDNNGVQGATFLTDIDGNIERPIDLNNIPSELIEELLKILRSGADLFFSEEELEEAFNPTHEHTYSEEWAYDTISHWHAATCEHTEEVSGLSGHDFNGGIETLAPTDTANGTMTYTCEVCGYSYEEKIPMLTHVHTWVDRWISNASGHWRAATCEHTELTAYFSGHTFNVGVVTLAPTETSVGTMTYTCDVCRYSYEEDIPVLEAEDDEDDNDDEEEEPAELPHEHTWSSVWSLNANNHWHTATCKHIYETADLAAHTYGEAEIEADEAGARIEIYTCTVCGYRTWEIAEPPSEEMTGLFAVDNVSYETWPSAAAALAAANPRTVYLLEDIGTDYYGSVSLPYDNEGYASDITVPAYYNMTWNLNGNTLYNGYSEPKLAENATWTITATGGGMVDTYGYGFNRNEGVLLGNIVIKGGMYDFDPTEYVPAKGYTVQMVVEPVITDATGDFSITYSELIEWYDSYSEFIINYINENTNNYNLIPGLWIVYSNKFSVEACTHDALKIYIQQDDAVDAYCTACGESWVHEHSETDAACMTEVLCAECDMYYSVPHDIVPDTYGSDEILHWNICSKCDEQINAEEHYGGEAAYTERAVCEVCEQPYGELLPSP